MTSHKLWGAHANAPMDVSIRAALQERVAGREPSSAAWEAVARKCTPGRLGVIAILRQRLLSAWMSGMRWTLPVFDTPAARHSEPHLHRHNVHWAWLDHHRVDVRLAC
jgi:hypothetical protein